MTTPRPLTEQDRLNISALRGDSRRTHPNRAFCATHARVKHSLTHSLTQVREGFSVGTLDHFAQVMTRVTHHKEMDFILSYT